MGTRFVSHQVSNLLLKGQWRNSVWCIFRTTRLGLIIINVTVIDDILVIILQKRTEILRWCWPGRRLAGWFQRRTKHLTPALLEVLLLLLAALLRSTTTILLLRGVKYYHIYFFYQEVLLLLLLLLLLLRSTTATAAAIAANSVADASIASSTVSATSSRQDAKQSASGISTLVGVQYSEHWHGIIRRRVVATEGRCTQNHCIPVHHHASAYTPNRCIPVQFCASTYTPSLCVPLHLHILTLSASVPSALGVFGTRDMVYSYPVWVKLYHFIFNLHHSSSSTSVPSSLLH